LNIHIDIVEVIQKKRLSYFGHIACTNNERFPQVVLHGYHDMPAKPHRREDPEKYGCMAFVTTVEYWACLRQLLKDLPVIALNVLL